MSETACKSVVARFFNEVLFRADYSSPESGNVANKTETNNANTSQKQTGLSEDEDDCLWRCFDIHAELQRKFPYILFNYEKYEDLDTWIKKKSICFKLIITECLNLKVYNIYNIYINI